ncbi:MAG TPA: DUF3967 domain-containing protein [Ureibacillus sp.]|nr:DUF3967 domain-containing protein [Ureibacillus sp.]
MSDTLNTTDISNMSDISNGDMVYDTLMVSNILGVQESTIRKYCALMQKHNYEFNKNSVGHRIFYAKDIEVIKKIIELKNNSSLTLNEAVKTILNSDIDDITDIETTSNQDYSKLLNEFKSFQTEQMNFNKQLLEQLEKQNNYIKNSLEERDRNLMHLLKESMESKKQIAVAIEEMKVENEKKKRSIFNFFKK